MITYQPKHLEPYTRPDHYIGATFPDYFTVYAVHRDSDAVSRSNFRSLLRLCGFAVTMKNGEVCSDAPNVDPLGSHRRTVNT